MRSILFFLYVCSVPFFQRSIAFCWFPCLFSLSFAITKPMETRGGGVINMKQRFNSLKMWILLSYGYLSRFPCSSCRWCCRKHEYQTYFNAMYHIEIYIIYWAIYWDMVKIFFQFVCVWIVKVENMNWSSMHFIVAHLRCSSFQWE